MRYIFRYFFLSILATQLIYTAKAQGCQANFQYEVLHEISSYTYSFKNLSTSSTPIISCLWSFGDETSSKLTNPEHQFLEEGIYPVSLTIYTADSCRSLFMDTIVVETVPPPGCLAFFTFLQIPQTVNYTYAFTDHSVSGNGDTINSYFWTFGDGQVSIFQNPIHQYQATGNYTVNLTIGTKQGCSSDYSFVVSVNSGTVACQASFTANADTLVNPLKYYFHDNSQFSTNIIAWKWYFDDGDSSSLQDPTHTFPYAGIYYVELAITTQGGCSSSSIIPIKVGNPQPYNLWGRIYAGPYVIDKCIAYLYKEFNNNHFKPIDTVRLTSINDTLGVYYFFQVPEGKHRVKVILPAVSQFSNDYAPTYFGDHVKWSNGNTINLFQNVSMANVNLESTFKSSGNCQINGSVAVNNTNIKSAYNIELLLFNTLGQVVDYTFTDAQGNFSFDDILPGYYFVSGEVTGLLADMIGINLTSNFDTIHNLNISLNSKTITGFINSKRQDLHINFQLFPNPSSDVLNLNFDYAEKNQSFDVNIYSIQGIKIHSQKIYSHQTNLLQISHYSKGVYLLQIIDSEDNKSEMMKFIKW